MPRGKYERKKKGDTAAVAAPVAAVATPKTAPATKSVTALPTPGNILERFAILRDNLMTLVYVRSQLATVTDIANEADSEILEHLGSMRSLRQQVFGKTSEELEAENEEVTPQVTAVGTNLPFPAFPTPSA